MFVRIREEIRVYFEIIQGVYRKKEEEKKKIGLERIYVVSHPQTYTYHPNYKIRGIFTPDLRPFFGDLCQYKSHLFTTV